MVVETSTASLPDESYLAAARALRPQIASLRNEIETGRRLPPALLEAMRAAGIFRLAMPRAWGGPELDPISHFQVLEELAMADASVGWCASIGMVGGYFTAFLDQEVARALYPSIDLVTAGANRPQGRATIVPGGYRVSGRWTFGSGVQRADRLVGGCMVYDGESPAVGADGSPEMRIVYLPVESAEVIDTWTSTGLRGSGSHDYAVRDVLVPEEHTFDIANGPVRRPGTLYAFRRMFLFCHAPMPIGIARCAIEAVQQLAAEKVTVHRTGLRDEVYVQTAVARAEAMVGAARSYVLDVFGDMWRTLSAGDELSFEQRARFRLAITHAHTAGVEAVELLYHAASGSSVYATSPLDRCLRDIHTINGHSVVSPKTYETAGRMFLGLEPGAPGF